MKLRPHHILCISHYVGEGYSAEFNVKMKELIKRLGEGESFDLVSGPDDLCAACPNLSGGLCKSEEKVKRYDKITAELLGVTQNGSCGSDVFDIAKKKIYSQNKFASVCSDCEWAYICHKSGCN
jgi:hypothetical protein